MPQHTHYRASALPSLVLGGWLAVIAAAPNTALAQAEQEHDVQTQEHADRKPNRLVNETSPYLLQHAYNPVQWYPWGEEAFEAARQADKPIFLSIGYSTCYWCHVMERESFEDEATAALLNANFIPIKVDREERPDVDNIYMTATQLLTGHGGWPMNVFLDPQTLEPFLTGTYFPPEPRHGMASFTQVLDGVTQVWTTRREDVTKQCHAVAEAVKQQLAAQSAPQLIGEDTVKAAVQQLMTSYDRNNGGFGRAPKFPQPVFLELLLGAGRNDDAAMAAVLNTLDHMATGGMYDQLGGGFHRYSTDGQWIVPHFEKMLYDNGQLLSVYAEAWQRSKIPLFEKVVKETAAYVLREMRDEAGGFFSAQDAEVDAREGLSYLWTRDEIAGALAEAGMQDDVQFALDTFGVSRGANFTDPHFPEDGPKYVLTLTNDDALKVGEQLERVQTALFEVRDKRKQPHTDDKVLAGWNGLMIAGLADAGRIFDNQEWIDAAAQAAEFVLTTMRSSDDGLLRVYRTGEARIDAFLEDYAFMIHGLLALHRATGDAKWLVQAQRLADGAHDRFFDSEHGGYFETLADRPDLFVRSKSFYDGAVPSGNGMMALNGIELYKRTMHEARLARAAATLRAASQQMSLGPSTCALSALALNELMTMQDSDPAWAWSRNKRGLNDPEEPRIVQVAFEGEPEAAADGEYVLTVAIDIAEGYHINAHDPGNDRLVGLTIELRELNGRDVSIAVEYPQGAPLDASSEFGKNVNVYRGKLGIPIRVSGPGMFRCSVMFQACSDVACLAPETVVLGVAIPESNR